MKSIALPGRVPCRVVKSSSCSLPHFPLTRPSQGKNLAQNATAPVFAGAVGAKMSCSKIYEGKRKIKRMSDVNLVVVTSLHAPASAAGY
jgi:hypothetical protein